MNKFQRFILNLKKCFFAKLNAKTGWGRNEIMIAFNEAVIESLSSLMEE